MKYCPERGLREQMLKRKWQEKFCEAINIAKEKKRNI